MENEVLKSPSEFDVSSAIKKWRSQGFSKEMIELARNDMAEYGMPFKQVSIYMDVKLSAGQAEQLSQALRNEVNEDFVRHLAEGGYSAEQIKTILRFTSEVPVDVIEKNVTSDMKAHAISKALQAVKDSLAEAKQVVPEENEKVKEVLDSISEQLSALSQNAELIEKVSKKLEEIEFNAFLERFEMVCAYPLKDYFNEYTFRMVGYALAAYAIGVVMYYTSQRNYMPGKEFGTSKLANVKQVNKVLADKEETNNRILSQNVRMSLNTRQTKLNNNMLIIGGSGAGKTFYEVKPNLMQMNSSFIITDPKGEILRSTGAMLKANGYNVKVINLLEMDKSDCYNPFSYIREETDVVKLITNIMSNTTPKGSTPSDPFWEKAEGLFLQALFYYVWLEEKPEKRNFATVLKLMGEAEVTEKGKPSPLDVRMKFLEESSPLGLNHPAVKQYNKCMRGAGDTVRSIIISANSRLATLENKQVLRLLSKDELNLAELGVGVNGDAETKTALFCVIPDSDKTYNFIIGMLYTQIFQELYFQADFNCGGRLPIHVTFMLDEFANVALPDDYCSLLSTMRSREISSVIIIQNLAQLKALFKDTWETIPSNCDTLVYLGGNEQSTHEYISKLLGKSTIDKKSSGETRGRQGSSSRNYDVLGREIMMPDEVRKMDNKKCLIFIRGFDPILDDKFSPFGHPMFAQSADGEGEPYVHVRNSVSEDSVTAPAFTILNDKALSYYEELQKKGEQVYIDKLSYEEFLLLGQVDLKKRFMDMDEAQTVEEFHEEQAKELMYAQDEKEEASNNIPYRLMHMSFTKEQKAELQRAMDVCVPKDIILSYFYPDTPVTRMMEIRRQYESTQ